MTTTDDTETVLALLDEYECVRRDQLRIAEIEAKLATIPWVVGPRNSGDLASRVAAFITDHRASVSGHAARLRALIRAQGPEFATKVLERVTRGELTLTEAGRLASRKRRGYAVTTDAKDLLTDLVNQVCTPEADARQLGETARGELWRGARRILAAAVGEVSVLARKAGRGTAEATMPSRRQVLEACEVLGLRAPRHSEHGRILVSAGQVSKRKKMLARAYHPDTLGGDRLKFERVIEAAELLEAYNTACAQAGTESE